MHVFSTLSNGLVLLKTVPRSNYDISGMERVSLTKTVPSPSLHSPSLVVRPHHSGRPWQEVFQAPFSTSKGTQARLRRQRRLQLLGACLSSRSQIVLVQLYLSLCFRLKLRCISSGKAAQQLYDERATFRHGVCVIGCVEFITYDHFFSIRPVEMKLFATRLDDWTLSIVKLKKQYAAEAVAKKISKTLRKVVSLRRCLACRSRPSAQRVLMSSRVLSWYRTVSTKLCDKLVVEIASHTALPSLLPARVKINVATDVHWLKKTFLKTARRFFRLISRKDRERVLMFLLFWPKRTMISLFSRFYWPFYWEWISVSQVFFVQASSTKY